MAIGRKWWWILEEKDVYFGMKDGKKKKYKSPY